MDPKREHRNGSRSKGAVTSWLKNTKLLSREKINDHTRSNIRMFMSRCTELFLREIEEHGYPFQCKVGNLLVSASSTAIEEQRLLKGTESLVGSVHTTRSNVRM